MPTDLRTCSLHLLLQLGACALAAGQTFVVTNRNDGGAGSLRAGLQEVNGGQANAVHFAIPGAWPHRVQLATPLPKVLLPVTIDATTQPGYVFGQSMVQLDSSGLAGSFTCLEVALSTVRGLHLRGPGSIGSNGVIASANSLVTDCVVGNHQVGVYLLAGSRLRGSRIGTDVSGMLADGNSVGVLTLAFGNRIGGANPADRNLISANETGAWLVGDAQLQGNWIGWDAAGTGALGNTLGVYVDQQTPTPAQVGGAAAGEGNELAFNTGGVEVTGLAGNRVLGNLFEQSGPPITLSPGQGHNYTIPSLAFVRPKDVVGFANAGDQIEVYRTGGDAACQSALALLGTATADAAGLWSLGGLALTPGDSVMATATHPASGTSEFSACLGVGECAVVSPADAGPGTLRAAVAEVNASGCGRILFRLPGAGPHQIQLSSPLPVIANPGTVIDGTSQPDYTPSLALVTLRGAGTGLHFAAGADGAEVRGLHFLDFTYGVHFEQSSGALIADNVFGCNNGVLLDGTDLAILTGNRFGTDVTGQTQATPYQVGLAGIHLRGARSSRIGGLAPGEGNQICHKVLGIWMEGGCSTNEILGNRIGLDVDGDEVIENLLGFLIQQSTDITIGGGLPGAGNLISGSRWFAGLLSGTDCRILGNVFGLDASGAVVLGNGNMSDLTLYGSGHELGGENPGEGNVIAGGEGLVGVPLQFGGGGPLAGGSTVPGGQPSATYPAFTGGYSNPIVSLEGTDIRITRTEIWGRGHKGKRIREYWLAPYPRPTALVATTSSVSGLASPGDRVEVFRSDGDLDCLNAFSYLGFALADGGGAWTLGVPSSPGDRLLATATGAAGNTSEFSACSPPVP